MTPDPRQSEVDEVRIGIYRWYVYRVIDMPGLARIELDGKRAVLVFTIAQGCEPAGEDFIRDEVSRMIAR